MDTTKRKRARLACKPCRDRKRRCDGCNPCGTCTGWGYDCVYESKRGRQASSPVERTDNVAAPSVVPAVSNAVSNTASPAMAQPSGLLEPNGGLVRRLEANSGAAFMSKLWLKMDASRVPRLNLFGWNVGARKLSSGDAGSVAVLPVTEIMSLEHMRSLAQTYFEKMDPCYGYIDQAAFYRRLEQRWATTTTTAAARKTTNDIYDSVLAGVAAIGCLFSLRRATITELHLARTARAGLDDHHLTGPPTMDLLTAWTLRCVYLRLTDTPHATWIASATLMHLTEAAGLHPGDAPSALLATSAHQTSCGGQQQPPPDPDLQARVVGVAHHMHAWTAFDLGLARVSFRDETQLRLPAPRPGDYTAEILGLLPASVSLDPRSSHRDDTAGTSGDATDEDDDDLMATLGRVVHGRHTQPPSVLAQCNLALCLLRRIHHTPHLPDWPAGLADQVLALLQKGLSVIPILMARCSPWHQTANVPFQTICMLLVLDTRASLALLPQALQTLNLVFNAYETDSLREACRAARLLVLLHQQRRRDDMAVFTAALGGARDEGDQTGDEIVVDDQGQIGGGSLQDSDQGAGGSPPTALPSAEDYAWVGALVADLPGLQRIDLDDLLTVDMLNDALGGSG